MDKLLVLKVAYETINNALEWGIDEKENTFAHFVDGIANMTDNLLRELEEKEQ